MVKQAAEPVSITGAWRDATPLDILRDLKKQGLLDYAVEEFAVFVMPTSIAFQQWMAQMRSTPIDFEAHQLPLDKALQLTARLSAEKGFALELDHTLPASWVRPVSLHLKQMPVDDVLRMLCRLGGLERSVFVQEGSPPTIQFFKAPAEASGSHDAFVTSHSVRIVRTVSVPAGLVESLEREIADSGDGLSYFAKRGAKLIPPSSVQFLPKSGKVVVKGTEAEIAKVEAVLAEWAADSPRAEVILIETRMLSYDYDAAKESALRDALSRGIWESVNKLAPESDIQAAPSIVFNVGAQGTVTLEDSPLVRGAEQGVGIALNLQAHLQNQLIAVSGSLQTTQLVGYVNGAEPSEEVRQARSKVFHVQTAHLRRMNKMIENAELAPAKSYVVSSGWDAEDRPWVGESSS